MTEIESYDRVSFLLYRLECAVHLLQILYENMNCDKYTSDMFAPAIYIAYEYLDQIEQALRQWKEEALPSPEAFSPKTQT